MRSSGKGRRKVGSLGEKGVCRSISSISHLPILNTMNQRNDNTGSDGEGLKHRKKGSAQLFDSLHKHLACLPKQELFELLVELSEKYPSVSEYLYEKYGIAMSEAEVLINSIRTEIIRQIKDPETDYDDEFFSLDCSGIKKDLEALLELGYADTLLEIGQELFSSGSEFAEGYDDEYGSGAIGIASCMQVVFEALPRSSLSPFDRMLYAAELKIKDEFELCMGFSEFWEKQLLSTEVWKKLAEQLKARLPGYSYPEPADGVHFYLTDKAELKRLMDLTVNAFERAGLQEEVIALCEEEAEKRNDYVRLINYLLSKGEREKAVEWIRKGTFMTRNSYPGITSDLRIILCQVLEKERNWLQAASLRAEDFFREPDISTYMVLKSISEFGGVWEEVRKTAIHYLMSGELPYNELEYTGDNWNRPVIPDVLPPSGAYDNVRRKSIEFPHAPVLLEVAIAEKEPANVLRWYNWLLESEKGDWAKAFYEIKVANAVFETYPEMAVEAWKKEAEALIAETNVKYYDDAAIYLKKIRDVMQKQGKVQEWAGYIEELRTANRRKRKLMQILDKVLGI